MSHYLLLNYYKSWADITAKLSSLRMNTGSGMKQDKFKKLKYLEKI